MPNAYTDMTSGTSLGLNLVKTGYEKLVAFKLRSEPPFRRVADTRASAIDRNDRVVVNALVAGLGVANSVDEVGGTGHGTDSTIRQKVGPGRRRP